MLIKKLGIAQFLVKPIWLSEECQLMAACWHRASHRTHNEAQNCIALNPAAAVMAKKSSDTGDGSIRACNEAPVTIHLARPQCKDKYAMSAIILKEMIDQGILQASPNALYILKDGIQMYLHLHPDGTISNANPAHESLHVSNRAACSEVSSDFGFFMPGGKLPAVSCWDLLHSTVHHQTLGKLRSDFARTLTAKPTHREGLVARQHRGKGNKLKTAIQEDAIDDLYRDATLRFRGEEHAFYTRPWSYEQWSSLAQPAVPIDFTIALTGPAAAPSVSAGDKTRKRAARRQTSGNAPEALVVSQGNGRLKITLSGSSDETASKRGKRTTRTQADSSGKRGGRSKRLRFKQVETNLREGYKCPVVKCSEFYADELTLDQHCRSVHAHGLHSKVPKPALEAAPRGAVVYGLEPADNDPATLHAIERSKARAMSAGVAPPKAVKPRRPICTSSSHSHPQSPVTSPLMPQTEAFRPSPIYLKVQAQIFAELWALLSTGVCLTTSTGFAAANLEHDHVLVPTYEETARVIQIPMTELYQLSGVARRADEARKAREGLTRRLLEGTLTLSEPCEVPVGSAGLITDVGVGGDLSNLMTSPSKAVSKDDNDDDDDDSTANDNLADVNSRRSRRARAGGVTLDRLARNADAVYDPFTLVHCDVAKEKIPFHVKITTDVMLVMDFHSHLSTTEIIGYLAGTYDEAERVLTISEIIPCPALEGDQSQRDQSVEMDPHADVKARDLVDEKGLIFAGWYHSHPTFPCQPSLRDIEAQTQSQELYSGQPYVGIINAPYYNSTTSRAQGVADVRCFWINTDQSVFFAENIFGTPIQLSYDVITESSTRRLSLEMIMNMCQYYEVYDRRVPLMTPWEGSRMSKLEKLRCSLMHRLPAELSLDVKSMVMDRIVDLLNMSEMLNRLAR
eukprot:TRINITY_DN11374_c0_g1_i1.p1 TRINITY_DN11374_c0_g1~~TRINITY_DN11374_c0_g1_i1.p1  ORF type:complete len:909 (+),score=132.32 TRINITY_DN11374_c0_g1_i1:983-3709(+)